MSEIALESRGSFQAEKHAASGAHAEVWRAQGTDGQAALKIARDAEQSARLHHAVQIADRVPGPRTLRAVDVSDDAIAVEWFDGNPFLDWCEGRSWADIRVALEGLATLLDENERAGVCVGELASRHLLVDAAARVRIVDLGGAFIPAADALPGTLHQKGFSLLLSELLDRRPHAPSAIHDLALALATTSQTLSWPDVRKTLRRSYLSPLLPFRAPCPAAMHFLTEIIDEVKVGERRVVVVYGARGSGRSNFLSSALRHARIAGFKTAKNAEDPKPTVWLGHASRLDDVAEAATAAKGHGAGLYLIESDRPLPTLGDKVIQYCLPPLTVEAVTMWWKNENLDADKARHAWELSEGHPATLQWMLASECKRAAPTTPTLTTDLLRLLRHSGVVSVADASLRLGVPALDVVDAAEPLVASGSLAFSSDGRAMRVVHRSAP